MKKITSISMAIECKEDDKAKDDLNKATHAWFLSCLIQADDVKSREDLSGKEAKVLKEMMDETMDFLESPYFAGKKEP